MRKHPMLITPRNSLNSLNDDLGAGIRPSGPYPIPQTTRRRVEERAQYKCEMPWCRYDGFCVVHHLTYRHKEDPLLSELLYVCELCHDEFHITPRRTARNPNGRIGTPELAAYVQLTYPKDNPWPSREERDQDNWMSVSYHNPRTGQWWRPGDEPPAEPW